MPDADLQEKEGHFWNFQDGASGFNDAIILLTREQHQFFHMQTCEMEKKKKI